MRDLARRLVSGETIEGADAQRILGVTQSERKRIIFTVHIALAFLEDGRIIDAEHVLEDLLESLGVG